MKNSALDRLNCTCVIIKVRRTIRLLLPQGKLWGEAGAMEVNTMVIMSYQHSFNYKSLTPASVNH